MKKIAIPLIIISLLLFGCTTIEQGLIKEKISYVCINGKIVDNPAACPTATPRPAMIAKATPTAEPTVIEPSDYSNLEQETFALINIERTKTGAQPIVWNEKIANVARTYAKELIDNEFFAHTDQQGQNVHERLNAAGVYHFVSNENLAQIPRDGLTAKQVVDGWMESPGHRSTIVDTDKLYSDGAVGAYCNTDYCDFVYNPAGLERTQDHSLQTNYYSFIALNDPGLGYDFSLNISYAISSNYYPLDVFLQTDNSVFQHISSMPYDDYERRNFEYLKKYEATTLVEDSVLAQPGYGLLVINTGMGTAAFNLKMRINN